MEGSIQHLEAGVPGRRWVNPQSRGSLGWEGRGAGKGEHRPGHPVWGRTPSRHHSSGQRAESLNSGGSTTLPQSHHFRPEAGVLGWAAASSLAPSPPWCRGGSFLQQIKSCCLSSRASLPAPSLEPAASLALAKVPDRPVPTRPSSLASLPSPAPTLGLSGQAELLAGPYQSTLLTLEWPPTRSLSKLLSHLQHLLRMSPLRRPAVLPHAPAARCSSVQNLRC